GSMWSGAYYLWPMGPITRPGPLSSSILPGDLLLVMDCFWPVEKKVTEYYCSIQAMISGSVGRVFGGMILDTCPVSSIRYFWKFHATSESWNPLRSFWVRNLYRGCMSFPLTEILAIMGKLTP